MNFDVIIFGANGSGIVAAAYLLQAGYRVAIIEQSRRWGGVWPAGLCQVDREIISGIFARWGKLSEIERRIGVIAGRGPYLFATPEAILQVFEDMIDYPNLVTTHVNAGDIVSLTKGEDDDITVVTVGGVAYAAPHFIDCTDEMDLAKAAGCLRRSGRDAAANTGEPTAGIRPAIGSTALGYDPLTGERLKWIQPRGLETIGDADDRPMAKNVRQIATQDPRRIQWKDIVFPPGYTPNPEDYRADLNLAIAKNYRNAPFSIGETPLLPRGAYELHDLNNGGGIVIGSDQIGEMKDWGDQPWAVRNWYSDEYILWLAGKFHTMATDAEWAAKRPQLVAALNTWGLVPGMYPDTIVPGFSPYIYVRQDAQLLAQYVYDTSISASPQRNHVKEPVSLVGYHPDAHGSQRYADVDGTISVEGSGIDEAGRPTVGWQVPWGSLKPHRSSASNLLVARATGGTRNAHIRMRVELSYIKMGCVCGIAVVVALRLGKKTADLDYETELRPALLAEGAVLEFPESSARMFQLEAPTPTYDHVWRWYASDVRYGRYWLADEATREDAIAVASSKLEPGMRFHLIEAILPGGVMPPAVGVDFYDFEETSEGETIEVTE